MAIDSEWFYRKLENKGASARDLAAFLGLDPSSVSRMLKGERKMSAEEQDRIADFLGASLTEVASRRRGDVMGFAEEGQAPFAAAVGAKKEIAGIQDAIEPEPMGGLNLEADNFYDRVRGCMKGTITIAPGVDLTEPADPEWAKVYDD